MRIVILGGGAVVRECFLPALHALQVLDRVTVVDANNISLTFPTAPASNAYRVTVHA